MRAPPLRRAHPSLSRRFSARQRVHVGSRQSVAANPPITAFNFLYHAPRDAAHTLAFDRDHRVRELADDLVFLFLAEDVFDHADLDERHLISPSLCLTRAAYCQTLPTTVIDSFDVSRGNCTGRSTGPVRRQRERAMLSLTVNQTSDQPLADQIVAGIRRQIDDRHLRPGTKLPSIRNFAE